MSQNILLIPKHINVLRNTKLVSFLQISISLRVNYVTSQKQQKKFSKEKVLKSDSREVPII